MRRVNNVLIYNSCCPFCCDLAVWLKRQVGEDVLEIAGNDKFDFKEIDFIFQGGNAKERLEKDVHLLTYEDKLFFLKSKGEAIISAMELNQSKFGKITYFYYKSKLFKWLFDGGYVVLKKSKSTINKYLYE